MTTTNQNINQKLAEEQKNLARELQKELSDIEAMVEEFEKARDLSHYDSPFRPKAVNEIYKHEMHSIAVAIADAAIRAIDYAEMHLDAKDSREVLALALKWINPDEKIEELKNLRKQLRGAMWEI